MKKYMRWSMTVVVSILVFAISFALIGFNNALYWNIYDYPSELRGVINTVLLYIGIAGGFGIYMTLGALPIMGTVDTIILLKQRRIKKREARKVKWLM